MSEHKHADHDRSREWFEYHAIYAVCFVFLLLPVAVRRLVWTGGRTAGRSFLGEARETAANCAAVSFMGL